jgi:hypothetical protein
MASYDYNQMPHQQPYNTLPLQPSIDPNGQYPFVTPFHYNPVIAYPSNTDTHLLSHTPSLLSTQPTSYLTNNSEGILTNVYL